MRYKKILRILKRRIESVKDMNKTTKEMISEYITDKTNKFDLVHTDMFTVEHQIKCTKKIKLNAKRNNVKFNSIQFI